MIKGRKKFGILKKVEIDNQYAKKIEKAFYDSRQFLKINYQLTIGRTFNSDRKSRAVGNSYNKSKAVDNNLEKMNSRGGKASAQSISQMSMLKKNEYGSQKRTETSMEVSDKYLVNLFSSIESRVEKNRYLTEEEHSLNKLPAVIKNNLKKQEKNLDGVSHTLSEWTRVAENLSLKSHKEKESLLMNKTDSYRMKKEIRELITRRQKLSKFGDSSWFVSLRRPDNFKGTREAFINLGKQEDPKWQRMIETVPDKMEMVRKPNSNSYRDLKNFTSNDYLTTTLTESAIEELENGKGDLIIVGENLLLKEREELRKLKGRKLLKCKEDDIPGNNEFVKDIVFSSHYTGKAVSVRDATAVFLK